MFGEEPEQQKPKTRKPKAKKAEPDPNRIWEAHFSKRKETPEAIRTALKVFMSNKRFKHASAMLKAAIRHGIVEPWMYEALALAQQAAGEPASEIRRTLLSAADVISENAEAQYRVARMLRKHELPDAAIRLYREAAAKVPFAHQPYEAILDLAAETGDRENFEWALGHLVARSWPNNHDALRKKAKIRVAQFESSLREKGLDTDADQLLQQVRQLDRQDLVIRLSWHGNADLDLEVIEPLGTICSTRNRMTPGGGVLVRDAMGKDGGTGSNGGEEYICSSALAGEYGIRVVRLWGRPKANRARIEVVHHQGTPEQHKKSYYVSVDAEKPLTVILEQGRRQNLLPIPQIVRSSSSQSDDRRTPIQQLHELAAREGGYRGPNQLFQVVARGGAVAFSPRIQQFFNGAGMSVPAVVSPDRRYVRMSIFPFFNNIVGERRFTISGAAGGGGGAFGF